MSEPAAEKDADHALDAFYGSTHVGRLSFDSKREQFGFTYSPAWQQQSGRFQLSPHLPLAGEVSAVVVRRYIDNLLPEGRALDVVSSFSHVQKSNLFALLRLLGRETAGAMSFLPAGERPATQAVRRHVSLAELQQRIDDRNRIPLAIWDERVRMSVADYQDKLLVLREGGSLFLADGSVASTHILKPESLNEKLPCMVANEHFCMRLVNRLGQRRMKENWAAEVEILRVPAPVLCVERFDRVVRGDRVGRRHVIDGCQALNLPVSHKYERTLGSAQDVRHIRDGASFEALSTLRPHLENAAIGIRQIAFWAIASLLLGNSDAHGKNLSFFCRGESLAVAPFYDMLSVAVYDARHMDQELAMGFGDAFAMAEVKSFALADFCERLGYPRRAFARELRQLCEWAREEAQEQARDSVYVDGERSFVRALAEYVVSRADFLLAQVPDIARFDRDLF